MERWYACFQCVGNRDQLLQKIEGAVRNNKLTHVFPSIAFERESGRGREFYLFVAVENHAFGDLPPDVSYLQSLSGIGQFVGPMRREMIQGMTSRELAVQNTIRRIPYRAPIADEDPFSESRRVWDHDGKDGQRSDETALHDRLITWMSAIGSGSIRSLAATVRTLDLKSDRATHILRNYKLLGHVETSDDNLWWSMAPPALVHSGSSDCCAHFFLAGQRDRHLLSLLQSLVDCRVVAHPYGRAPAIVEVQEDEVVIEEIAEESRGGFVYSGKFSVTLARLLPSLDEWTRSLRIAQQLRPSVYHLKRFNGTDFVDTSAFDGTYGLYEFWPLSNQEQRGRVQFTAFFDEDSGHWLRGDWYGLRFLTHRAMGEEGSAQYDRSSYRFAIHQSWRFPEIYERALVLSSGRLPRSNNSWLIYDSVNPETAMLLSSKLDLNLEERILDA